MSAEREKICPSCGARYHSAATFCQADGRALVIAELTRDPLLGQVLLDQFRIEEKIGSGGMGTVYRAHQTSIGRDVAVKVLHPELAQNAEAIRRFQREARVATSLDHPNVVRVFLYGDLPDRTLYLVMEHLEGRPLLDLLGQGPLPLERALHIATQICDGVGEAHARGIVHRDIKPENILIVRRGADPDFVKVLDFGIARVLWDEHTQVTQSGMIFGTAKYISPEGASGEATDMRSDVYSIAVLAYQLLTGEVPFSGRTPVSLLMKHIHQPAADIRTQPGGR
ncbi:MAG: protein kinase, partial [Myxococcales bacterium]|nr:protein kinase [Myxococcales bacterium]